ncbi:origin recognition complex subunit 5 isoform X2 [Takifugu rubripes]|uniref:origin recognition complex subunit 5 isoform X2 n=1 Tax=Takifugu rubripes TaxID=31033 RepID=UPI00114576D6|nr:origin recognition complex subunit 5 isoform X2 [Takifugu rubripes]
MTAVLQQPGYDEERLRQAAEQLPSREVQAGMLLSLMGEPDQYSYPSIFIYGHQASGKSYVMQVLLRELELPHAAVSCVECVSAALLFEHVLRSFFGDDAASRLPRSPSLSDFVRVYRQQCSQSPAKQTRYIVMEKAELLRDADANILPAFLRLQELVEDNITVILLSEIVWDKFRPNTGCLEPLLLHFPDYSKAKETDTHKLWRNIEPHLKRAMQTVYLREVSSLQWEQMQQMEEKECGALRGLSAHTHIELPYYSKFLLIAAYLASYNPARTDKRFFVKHHGKIRKTNFLKKNEKTSNHLLGPKPFPLDRLLAIFYSVVDSRVAPSASIFSQISSLVTLQLLTKVSHDDQLDAPKYKCSVSMDFICAISRTVNFDIIKYLYDFL